MLIFYYFDVASDMGRFFYGNNEACLGGKGKIYDAKRILRGYLTAKEDFMSENELVDGVYGKKIRSLKEKYETLQQEDKVRQEELNNIYNSKRFKLACAMEKVIKPFKG